MIQNNTLFQSILEQIEKLSDTDKLNLIDEVLNDRAYFLDHRIITTDTIIEELQNRIEWIDDEDDRDEIKMFLENNTEEFIFNIISDCSNENLIEDFSSWDENDEDILNYIDLDIVTFIKLIKPFNTAPRRDKVLSLLGI
jgi:hypothetical protein